jgi:hypothetical protein
MEKIKQKTGRKPKHGMWKSKEWNSWNHLKGRCNNPNDRKYADYGARGIKVCDRWNDKENGFTNFLADMGFAPSLNHSIDRFPDNNGNYERSNCRWATTTEQSNNIRRNVVLVYLGQSKTVSEWSRLILIPTHIIYGRIKKGWTDDKVLSTPPRRRI